MGFAGETKYENPFKNKWPWGKPMPGAVKWSPTHRCDFTIEANTGCKVLFQGIPPFHQPLKCVPAYGTNCTPVGGTPSDTQHYLPSWLKCFFLHLGPFVSPGQGCALHSVSRQVQMIFSTAGCTLPQLEWKPKGTQLLCGFLGPWGSTWLDADTPCDSSSHLGSGWAHLRPWLLGLAHFLRVSRVGTGTPTVRDSTSGKEKFLRK